MQISVGMQLQQWTKENAAEYSLLRQPEQAWLKPCMAEKLKAARLFGRMADALAAEGEEGRGKLR